MQDDLGHLAPIRVFSRSVEQADVGEQALFIIARQDWHVRRNVGDIRIEEWSKHSAPKITESKAVTFFR